MDLENRISLLVELGEFMQSRRCKMDDAAKTKAFQHNPWFIPDFIEHAVNNIAPQLSATELTGKMAGALPFSDRKRIPKK